MFAEPVLLIGRKMRQPRNEDLPLFAECAGHEGDVSPLGGVLRHHGTRTDAFVIRMGVHEQQATVAHAWQPSRPAR